MKLFDEVQEMFSYTQDSDKQNENVSQLNDNSYCECKPNSLALLILSEKIKK